MYWTLRRRLVDIATRLSVLRDRDRPQPGKSVYGSHLDGYETFGASHHRFQRQPLQRKQIRALEKAMGVRLPDEFRLFLKWLGTGAGPYYGIRPFDELLEAASPACARPFPWTEADTFWLDEDRETDPDGCLPIITYGCGDEIVLVTAGQHRGRVVHLGLDFDCVPGLDFLTFYDVWVIESLTALHTGMRPAGRDPAARMMWRRRY
ncbi:hypothetical protein JOD54_004453 [Actinokineospora baliensis]|uniref:SMI1/KNR4 family protein n=1 Tax=Actinokineospora baliensis TaxID=547056 RepID=UPI00195A32D3|nr:SMI1/KNR4 family protein [Actinokineospora baliensis]MBM7774249.1 hypothetical protein [Actinokineospora baliensis]